MGNGDFRLRKGTAGKIRNGPLALDAREIVRRGTLPDNWPGVVGAQVFLVGVLVGAKADKTRNALVQHQTTARLGHHTIGARIKPPGGDAGRGGHGLAVGAMQPGAAVEEFLQAGDARSGWRALHLGFAVEEQVEGCEAKSVGLGESTTAHRRVGVEDPRSAIGACGA